MSAILDEQIKQVKQAIAELETQRSILGDPTVEAAVIPLHQKLAELEAQAETPPEEPAGIPTRQRKLATILFMDVVGSTAMTHDLDPEDQMGLVDPLISRLAEKIGEFGGHVTRYTGDGFKAVFGLPFARENDPEQAICAGLAVQAEATEIAAELESERNIQGFQVRVGISTGLVFAGGETEGEDTIKGNPVNLAARLQSAVPPGGLLISHDTYRHVRGVFNVDSLEPITAKGFPEPVPVYLVRELKPRAFRVQTRGVEGVETRMVGRETELKYLQDALLTAIEESEGQVVTISGEAGVGKSRLLYEFQNWIELLPPSHRVRFFQGRGWQESQGLPYSLLRDLFAFRFQISDDDTGGMACNKIEIGFGEVFGTESDGMMRAHILGQLLGFDFSGSLHLKGVLNDPEQLRNRGEMYLVQFFRQLLKETPVVIFLEDIHWGDDSSLNVVNKLAEFPLQLPFLILCTARSVLFERYPQWGKDQIFHNQIKLLPLSEVESQSLLVEILKFVEEIPTNIQELVISKAEGNPLYMEELIKLLIEDNVIIPEEEIWRIKLTNQKQVDVPSTLAGVLQARLDSLPIHERKVLQKASVVGRIFWDHVVTYMQVEGGDGDDPQLIHKALTSLRNRELVYRHKESAFTGAVEYLFKHDLFREVTYESVLKGLRIPYHRMIADWLITNSGDRVGEYSGLIAQHLLLAKEIDQACEYFLQAGESALASFANGEAEGYYRKALELSPPVQPLAVLLSGLGEALFRQGESEESEATWRQAIKLYQDLGDSDHLGDVFARLSRLIGWRNGFLKAWDLCQEGLKILEGAADSSGYARLLAEGGRTALFSEVTDQVIPLCLRAVEMSKRVGNLEVQLEASNTLAVNTDDKEESVVILKEVIEIAEENSLLATASRAHNNIGAMLGDFFIDINSALSHEWRAAELANQIGDIDRLMFYLGNVSEYCVNLGELCNLEDKLAEFLETSEAPEYQVEEFLDEERLFVMEARGEWYLALVTQRRILKDIQGKDNYQKIYRKRIRIANIVLDLNRFGYSDDLSEAESVLLENIEQTPSDQDLLLLLGYVRIRQGRLPEAYDLLKREIGKNNFSNNLERLIHLEVNFEFAMAEGLWTKAIAASKSMIEISRNCGNRWGWARRLIDLGDAYLGRNEPGDLEKARKTYQQSLDMFIEMGAPGYIKVLEERLEAIGDMGLDLISNPEDPGLGY